MYHGHPSRQWRTFAGYLASLASVLGLWTSDAIALDRPPPEPASAAVNRDAVQAATAMVATANPMASDAALEILRRGGSAADAMVTAQLVLNLVEPQSSGLGGGAFLVYWDAATGELTSLDGRETAPAAIGPDWFQGPDGEPKPFYEALVGGGSVGVPGTPRLLQAAHERWGRLPWAELFAPAIELARDGFAISPRLADSIAEARDLDRFTTTKAYFFDDAGAPKSAGSILANPAFVETLERIAADGADAFYEGPLATEIVHAVGSTDVNPGRLSEADLAAYEVVEREPVCEGYRIYLICGMGPPSSGGLAVGQIMGLLEHVDMAGLGPSLVGLHYFLEAQKLAFADRDLYVADADFVRVPATGMLDDAYLTTRAQLMERRAALPTPVAAGNPPWEAPLRNGPDGTREEHGTSHLVIVDADGNALSMTTTIESGFGSRVMAGGFLLNNELTDFAFAPEAEGLPVANRVEGGKRPRSSMAPTIVLGQDGRPYLLVGSPGGSRIIGYVAKTLLSVLDWGLDPQAASAFGNLINRNGATELEVGTDLEAFAEPLRALGHEVDVREQASGVQAVLIRDGSLIGGADPRREGTVVGY